MDIERLNKEIAALTEEIKPLVQQRDALKKRVTRMKSRAWIEANGVTHENLQLSTGDGLPRFLLRTHFVEWLAKQGNPKRFCEWATCIMFTREFIAGRLEFGNANIDELPKPLTKD